MKLEDIKKASIDALEARQAEIRSIDINTVENPREISEEIDAIEARKKELRSAEEAKKELREKINKGEVKTTVIEKPSEDRTMENKFDIKKFGSKEELRSAILKSEEYRVAFSNYLRNGMKKLSEEQRTLFTHTTGNTGVLLPTQIVDEIWDLVHGLHCITGDVDEKRTGVVISVKVHKTISAGKAKEVNEGEANDDEQNTFAEYNLAGKDFSKTVKLSYAQQKMTNLEDYVIKEIADDLAEALAKDIVTTIEADVNVSNKVKTEEVKKLAWKDLTAAFAKVKAFKKGGTRKVYVNETTYYDAICGATDVNGRPLLGDNSGVNATLKAEFKIEDAIPDNKLFIGIPTQYVNNVVQDVMIETDKDIESHKYIYSGYARAEGKLVNDKAFAILEIKQV